MNEKSPIGVFDSGLGGISVLETMHRIMPNEDLIYLGDSLYNPYGTKTKEAITERCITICDEFMAHDVKAIVVACNTATSACIKLLRERYDIDIIGMEPALKVASEIGEHQKIAVFATQLTLSETKFKNLMDKFKDEHDIKKVACPKLVRLVEDDKLDDQKLVDQALDEYIGDDHDLDSIVLGCTHFVFYKQRLMHKCPDVHIVDGNMGTTLHVKDLLATKHLLNDDGGKIMWMNTLPDKIELSKRLFERLENENE